MSEINRLGKYEIIKELGRGGFGIAYEARDTVLNRRVALKVLHPALIVDPQFVNRFRREAEFAAQMEHANIVPIYDFDQQEGRFFTVMGLMANGSIKDLLSKYGHRTPSQTKSILEQIASGLAYAHDQGVIHRDLKPSNILVDEHGVTRISDFGFAKAMSTTSGASLSITGGLLGTPAYMAPEIWEGKEATAQSDIYSLGCIAYEMLTGQTLFEGDSAAQIMTKHVIHNPQISDEIPQDWQDFLKRCLAKNPKDRYPSVKALLEDLRWGAFDGSVKRESEIVLGYTDTNSYDTPISDHAVYQSFGKQMVNDAVQIEGDFEVDPSINSSSMEYDRVVRADTKVRRLGRLLIGIIALVLIILLVVYTQIGRQNEQTRQNEDNIQESQSKVEPFSAMPSDTATNIPTVYLTSTPTRTKIPTATNTPKPQSISNLWFDDKKLKLYSEDPEQPYSRMSDAELNIFIQVLGEENDIQVTNGKNDFESIIWSPDGNLIAAVSDGDKLVIIDPIDGSIETIASGHISNREISWNPTRNEIAYRDGGSVKIVNVDTLKISTVVEAHRIQPAGYDYWSDVNDIGWSSDGEYLGFWTRMATPDSNDERGWTLWTIKRDGTDLRMYSPPENYGYMSFKWVVGEHKFLFTRFSMSPSDERGPYEWMVGDMETGVISERSGLYKVRLECYYPIDNLCANNHCSCYTWSRDN